MAIRIFTLHGPSRALREQRLETIRAWMESHGWQLGDLSEEVESALFERPEGAPDLPRIHATRWLPAPEWYRPREWLEPLWRQPRRLLLGAGLMVAVAVVFVAVLSVSHGPPAGLFRGGGGGGSRETWLFVGVDSLNVRESPLGNSQIVGVLYKNQKVLVGKRQDDWVQIITPARGFVAEKFLSDHPAP